MIKTKIKTEKQENGLYGIPLNCKKIINIPPKDDKLYSLISSILIIIDDYYKCSFNVKCYDNVLISTNLNSFTTLYFKYDLCLLVDDEFIYFNDLKEKETYMRKIKIKKILDINK